MDGEQRTLDLDVSILGASLVADKAVDWPPVHRIQDQLGRLERPRFRGFFTLPALPHLICKARVPLPSATPMPRSAAPVPVSEKQPGALQGPCRPKRFEPEWQT